MKDYISGGLTFAAITWAIMTHFAPSEAELKHRERMNEIEYIKGCIELKNVSEIELIARKSEMKIAQNKQNLN